MAPSVWYRSYVSMKTSVGHWLANVAEQLMEEPMAVAVAKDLPEWDEGHVPLETVDPKDQNTPDCWVPRDKTIVRLTGRHPLNCEPPMAKMIEDFITPPAIHFVRNHGAVPKLSWRTHQIRVNGLVDSPLCITMQELLQMPAETIPVTMACAGNRRKENNAIKRTLGFGWGSSATSCTYMTGVKLHYILRLARIRTQEQGANYVCYRGPTQELPQGEDGSYGTSISVSHALDPVNDVMIVYKQNGEWLLPDHGYPVRMVVPGLIGARSVKWLSQITVTREESNNFYHYHDNKVLPPHVDDKIAREEGWFYKPDFIINELNINSAIARPSHDEFVSLKRDEPYKVQGYAYSGGGRKVIRVEVSLDDGDTWRACEIHRFEKPRVSGKHWCWVLWDIELRISELTTCKEIVCRAWDSSQNNQPNKITWNVMGMMNNSHFRVRIHKHLKEDGEIGLRFQHPAPSEAGQWGSPGWRQQEQEAKPDEETLAMLPRIIDDEDIVVTEVPTKPLPGTPGSLSRTHTNPNLPERLLSMNLASMNLDDHQPLIALNRKKKIPFKLIEKTKLSRDARRLRFALQSPQHILGLPIGNHMFFYAEIDGQTVMREYTPTSSNKQVGYFDLVIKVYFAGENPRFPEGGKMSQHFERMQVGDTIDVKGPVGHFVYSGPGKCLDNRRPHSFKKMCMVAGGTGITPMFQVADHILHDPNDDTQITLLFANRHEEDILMRDDLDEWSAKFRNFKVHYTLDRPPQGWEHNTGHIDYKMLERTLPSPDNESIVCLCGPPQMIKHACIPNLELLGWRKDQIVIF